MSDNIFDQSDHDQLPDGPTTSRGSSLATELMGAGYKVKEMHACPKCYRALVVYESPDGSLREFNSPTDPISPGGLHQLTCRESVPEVKLPPVPDQQAYIDAITGKGNGDPNKK